MDLLIELWGPGLGGVKVATARASGAGNRCPVALSPLWPGERQRRLDLASWSGQRQVTKTYIERSSQPTMGCGLAHHMSVFPSLHGLLVQPVGEQRNREARWEGVGLGSVLQTASRRPAPKALLRPW